MPSRAQSESYWPVEADIRSAKSTAPSTSADDNQKADWSAYAASYDLLSEYNPAYQDLLVEFEKTLTDVEPPKVIFDVGGGTGTYSQIAAKRFPESTIYFVEPDKGMNLRAREKLSAHENVVYIEKPFQEVEAPTKADFIICAHALYSMPAPQDRLDDLKNLLRPGGMMFLLDLGRPMDVADWRSYLFSHLVREYGFVKAIQVFWNGREIAKQNKAIFKAQQENLYWTHTEAEMTAAVEKAGFEVMAQKTVYRGYSDLLLCRAAL